MHYPNIDDIEWRQKAALWRADFNVPLANGKVADDSRLRAALLGIKTVLTRGGGVLILSHLGRPKEGAADSTLTLKPIAEKLSELLQQQVHFCLQLPQCKPPAGEVWMLENTRFNLGEKDNDAALAARYAQLGDVFVLDAFATAHRKESSTCALANAAAAACAGPLLIKELAAINTIIKNPPRPAVALIGGGKISTKLPILSRLAKLCDRIIVGGGIANTFLAAAGHPIGASLAEINQIAVAEQLLKQHSDIFMLPSDVRVAADISENATPRTISVVQLSEMRADEKIGDIGPESAAWQAATICNAGTVFWNGPAGVFECAPFADGTAAWARAAAKTSAYTLAGGGDTLAAVAKFNVGADLSYLSTGGGALLEALGGAELPALVALAAANQTS